MSFARENLTRDTTTHGKIVSTPGTCSGEPRVTGTRIRVTAITDLYRSGSSIAKIVRGFSGSELTEADVHAAIRYELAHGRPLTDEHIELLHDEAAVGYDAFWEELGAEAREHMVKFARRVAEAGRGIGTRHELPSDQRLDRKRTGR